MSHKLNNLPALRIFRKELRHHLTPAEAGLWTILKRSQLDGRKFRRQHSVGGYILDFYCPAERLAIELDGEVHNTVSAQEYDLERDIFLRHCGIKVLRFENQLVFQQTEALIMEIRRHFGWYQDTTPPTPQVGLQVTTPPLRGTPQVGLQVTTPPLRGTPPCKGGEL